jgi:hypothetical protein
MSAPSPPAATYPAMSSRVGYSNGSALTQGELDTAFENSVVQDGNGNSEQLQCIPIGGNAFLTCDSSNTLWLSSNAYYWSATGQWYANNTAQASFAISISPSGVQFNYAAASDLPLVWSQPDGLNQSGLLSTQTVLTALAAVGTSIYASTAAAQADTTLANGAYFYLLSTRQFGLLDLYEKVNSSTSTYEGTVPQLLTATVLETTDFTVGGPGLGAEVNAFTGAVTVTIPPAHLQGRDKPYQVRKIDQSTNTVSISDGTTVHFTIATPAIDSTGNGGGWCDVWCDPTGTYLRCQGVP